LCREAVKTSKFLIALQFFRPIQNTSSANHDKQFLAETNPPKEVKVILEQTCYDCHSNNTNYPWYNNIAPISYWLSSHIKDGKKHLNFSDWSSYSAVKKVHKLEEVKETVEEQEMPLKEYTWTHYNAVLSTEEKNKIVEWVKRSKALYQLKNLPE